jgi:hypothetical protein
MSWHIVGYSVGGLFALIGLWGLVDGVLGLTGRSTGTLRFACDRTKGECRRSYPLRTVRYSLADVTGAEVKSTRRSLGRGARFETQFALALNLQGNKEGWLTDWTGDEATTAKLRDAASQIQTFLAGKEATLSINLGTKASYAWSWRAIFDSVLLLAGVAVLIYVVRR